VSATGAQNGDREGNHASGQHDFPNHILHPTTRFPGRNQYGQTCLQVNDRTVQMVMQCGASIRPTPRRRRQPL
jgi:hypothetical protein